MALPALPLKDFDESRIGYVLRMLMLRLQDESGQPQPSYVQQRLSEIAYGAKLALGFAEGLFTGARARYRVMQDDFRRDYAAIQKLFGPELAAVLGRGLAASFDEFILRPVFESVPTGLTPQSAAAAQRLIEMFDAMALLETIGVINDIAKAGQFFDMLGTGVDDLYEALMLEGQRWGTAVVLEPDAHRQGVMIGQPIGVAIFEVVRAIVEPPPLDAAHLISSLALTAAEQKALGL